MTAILETVSRDLDWREREIAAIRILLTSTEITPGQRLALLRAAWAMLYAHYEGFCKNTLITYYDSIAGKGLACSDLPFSTRVFALDKNLKRLKTLCNSDLLEEILSFRSNHLSPSPEFPDIETQSNLWPSVLIELLRAADLSADKVREHEVKLKTLVSRRNKIAHGENNIILEVGYFRTYEHAVYDVMYDLAIQVDHRLSLPPYMTTLVIAMGS